MGPASSEVDAMNKSRHSSSRRIDSSSMVSSVLTLEVQNVCSAAVHAETKIRSDHARRSRGMEPCELVRTAPSQRIPTGVSVCEVWPT